MAIKLSSLRHLLDRSITLLQLHLRPFPLTDLFPPQTATHKPTEYCIHCWSTSRGHTTETMLLLYTSERLPASVRTQQARRAAAAHPGTRATAVPNSSECNKQYVQQQHVQAHERARHRPLVERHGQAVQLVGGRHQRRRAQRRPGRPHHPGQRREPAAAACIGFFTGDEREP